MIGAPAYNSKGESGEKINLPVKLFGTEVKPVLLARAVRVFLANRRKSNAKTKTRGEITKTTAKMYKQKGTGRARHGAYSAPIFVGGGVAHGPTGGQNYKLSLPKRLARRALLGALSEKARAKEISIFPAWEKGKVKLALTLAKTAEFTQGRRLVILGIKETETERAWRNIEGVTVAKTSNLNPYLILTHRKIGITREALKEIEKIFAT